MTIPARITIKTPFSNGDKISCIKSIRALTGLGLKDAKDIADASGIIHEATVFPGLSYLEFEQNCRILRNAGVEVGGAVFTILEDLRDLGAQALKQGEDELAAEILQLVLAEKLRRKIYVSD
jgi:hypothetical protein